MLRIVYSMFVEHFLSLNRFEKVKLPGPVKIERPVTRLTVTDVHRGRVCLGFRDGRDSFGVIRCYRPRGNKIRFKTTCFDLRVARISKLPFVFDRRENPLEFNYSDCSDSSNGSFFLILNPRCLGGKKKHSLLHRPLYAIGMALPIRQAACRRWHALWYVRPSEPHTSLDGDTPG